MKVSAANKSQMAGTGSNKPEPVRQLPKSDPMVKVSENLSKVAETMQQSIQLMAQQNAVQTEMLMQSNDNLSQAIQVNLPDRPPVRVKINRVWDKVTKTNQLDSLDILPLVAKQ